MWAPKTLIRLGRCPGWSESLLGAHAILLVLSWGGSNASEHNCYIVDPDHRLHQVLTASYSSWVKSIFEPRHDKTNKVSVRPAKTQISLGIHPVWSVFAVCMKKAKVLSYPLSAQRRLWSDWVDAQADLSLCLAHTYFVGFVMSQLIFFFCLCQLQSSLPNIPHACTECAWFHQISYIYCMMKK